MIGIAGMLLLIFIGDLTLAPSMSGIIVAIALPVFTERQSGPSPKMSNTRFSRHLADFARIQADHQYFAAEAKEARMRNFRFFDYKKARLTSALFREILARGARNVKVK